MVNAIAIPENGAGTALAARDADGQQAASISLSLAEKVLVGGDLAALSPPERLQYYQGLCQSLGLNPLTRPFEYLELQGKLTLYAKKDATEQLRRKHGVSIYKVESFEEPERLLYTVRAYARTADGREDIDEGAVSLEVEGVEWKTSPSGKRYKQGTGVFTPLRGEELVNARLKALTKAKRRVTLSICGLGLMDESEIESVAQARVITVDHETGVIIGSEPLVEPPPEPAGACSAEQIEVLLRLGRQLGKDEAWLLGWLGIEGWGALPAARAEKAIVKLGERAAREGGAAPPAPPPSAPASGTEREPAPAAVGGGGGKAARLRDEVGRQLNRLQLTDEVAVALRELVLPGYGGEQPLSAEQAERLLARLKTFKDYDAVATWVDHEQGVRRRQGVLDRSAQSGEPRVVLWEPEEIGFLAAERAEQANSARSRSQKPLFPEEGEGSDST